MSFFGITLIIVIVLIIAFLIFMIITTDNNNELDNFKRKSEIIDIDLTKAEVKSNQGFIKKPNVESTLITVYYNYRGKELKHEETVNMNVKYVKETVYIRRETTLFIDPDNPTSIHLDLRFLYRNIFN